MTIGVMGKKRLGNHAVLALIFFLLWFVAVGCSSGGGGGDDDDDDDNPPQTATGAKWTYMVYVAGDNNLSTAAFGDINEMEQVGSDENINIVVQVEFSRQFSRNLPENTLRGRISKDNDTDDMSSSLKDIGNKDMGNKDTLSQFISWAASTYPAEHYALVLWDHGAGWKNRNRLFTTTRGALEDATSGSFMSLPDIAEAVEKSGVKPDLINFDACLMAMYEVVYEFSGLTDYMVFSEEVEPGEGDPYDTILNALKSDPNMTAETLCKTITGKFKTFYQIQDRSSVTKSSVDMSYVPDLHTKLKALAAFMNDEIGTERPNIQLARDKAVNYDYPENRDLKSFFDYLESYTSDNELITLIASVKTVLNSMIVSNDIHVAESTDIGKSCGLAIYIPQRDQVTDSELTEYARLAINQTRASEDDSWGGFVNTLVTGDNNEGMGSLQTEPGNFVIWLEWDTDADLDLNIMEPDETIAAPYIGASSANGFLSEDSAYSGEPVEYYAAGEQVEAGDYLVFIEYYSDGVYYTGPTTAYLYIFDPENGDTDFQLIGSRYMGLSHPAPLYWYYDDTEIENVVYDVYSDWWFPYLFTRSLGGEDSLDIITAHGKSLSVVFRSKTKKRKDGIPDTGCMTRMKDVMRVAKDRND